MLDESNPQRRDLRESLVETASRRIAQRGYQALKARELAAEVGCAVGSIYNVFPDIDALILSVQARFLALGRVYLDFAARNWRLWSSVFEHRANGSEALQNYRLHLDAILTHIEQPVAALLPRIDAAARGTLARTLFAAVHGVVSLGLDGKFGAISASDLHAELQGLLGAALSGLRARHPL